MDKDNELFSEEELEILAQTRKIRKKMIEEIALKEDQPRLGKEMESFTGLMDSLDKNVMSLGKLRMQQKSNETAETSNTLVREIIAEMHKTSQKPTEDNDEQLEGFTPPSFKPKGIAELNEHVTKRKIDSLDYKEIIGRISENDEET